MTTPEIQENNRIPVLNAPQAKFGFMEALALPENKSAAHFMFIGFGLCALTLIAAFSLWVRTHTLVHATGRVVAVDLVKERTSRGPTTTYAPVVEFRTEEGEDVRFTGVHNPDYPYKTGQTVDVWYAAKDPAGTALLFYPTSVYVFLVVGLLGFFTGIAGLLEIKKSLRQHR